MMKKTFLLLLFPLFFISCLDDGGNYIKYTGWINIDTLSMPDTAKVGQAVHINVRGGAPNGCWSNLEISLSKRNDSLVYITGTGIYESTDGICTQVYQLKDTTFIFIPSKVGMVKFIAQSPDNKQIIDSLFVVDSKKMLK